MECSRCSWKGNALVCKQCRDKEAGARPAIQAPNVEQSHGDESVGEKTSAGLFARCSITVHSKRKRLADTDGISCKAIVDGLRKAGVFRDDNAAIIEEVRFKQEKATDDETIIIVEAI